VAVDIASFDIALAVDGLCVRDFVSSDIEIGAGTDVDRRNETHVEDLEVGAEAKY
jgi:hypothetical protein